jgi:outer membrane receptor for ferric coprogen and ferric-rhodotorulic acid
MPQPVHLKSRLLVATALAFAAAAIPVTASAEAAAEVESVVVYGATSHSAAATGLDLSLRQTPQSVTVIDRSRIEDFDLKSVNDLLDQVVGVNVQRVETDRTYYDARGFDVTNFQVGGVGLPLIWGIQYGDLDTVLFERVEAVRGANALMTGVGNPSATINYVRKRPTVDRRASLALQYGSWNEKRLEADISGAVTQDGALSGRLIYANEDKDSYLDHYGVNRNVYLAALTWKPTSSLSVTAGYTRQDNRAKGVLWGALPLVYADGGSIPYPRSASTSADWTYWNTRDENLYAEAVQELSGGWRIKAVGLRKRFEENARLLYAYGNPDRTTGLGVFGMSGVYPSTYKQWVVDLSASGPVEMFGRRQELVFGANISRSHGLEYENFSADVLAYPPVDAWATQQIALPSYPGAYLAADQRDRMTRLYAAAHLDLADRVKAVVGVNWVKLTSRGFSYGVDTPRRETAASPYAGLIVDLTPNVSAYASYTDIFNPQTEVDGSHRTLPAAHGKSYEAGLKSEWFDRRLYATAAVFKAQQDGLAEVAGAFPDGKLYYSGLDTRVSGYEFEVAGRVGEAWTVGGGWTGLRIKDTTGLRARIYVPRRTLKLNATWSPPDFDRLKLGAALRWQSKVATQDLVLVTQRAYAVVDLMASLRLTPQIKATVNIKNLGDERYLTSLKWNQAYFAEPRSVSLTLAADF